MPLPLLMPRDDVDESGLMQARDHQKMAQIFCQPSEICACDQETQDVGKSPKYCSPKGEYGTCFTHAS